MTAFDEPTLTLQVMFTAAANDPESSRIGREGLAPEVVRGLAQLIVTEPGLGVVLGAVVRPDLTEGHIFETVGFYSRGPRSLVITPVPDLASWVRRIQAGNHDGGALTGAFAGLLALALIEGLARAHRPTFDQPYLAMNAIEEVALPVADLLLAADLPAGGAELAGRLRSFILTDDHQRGSAHGRRLLARCRRIERVHPAARRVACQEAAWMLRERAENDPFTRMALATVLYASGDPLRSFAVGRYEHLPSVAVLTDVIEMGLQISATDELLRAVWNRYLVAPNADLPERVALPFCMRRRDVNTAFKASLEAFKAVAGVELGDAYAKSLFGFVTGLWQKDGYESDSWSTILEAMRLPIAWSHDPGSFVRILDIYNLAVRPGSQLPAADHIYAFTDRMIASDTDIRPLVSASLSMDTHTGRRGQLGRSLTYDSPFVVEPWRRDESVIASINALEAHRFAGLTYWRAVVPSFTPAPRNRKERATVREDADLIEEYQSSTALAGRAGTALHHQIYGDGKQRRTLRISEAERALALNELVERRDAWEKKAWRDFPSHTALRNQPPWKVSDVQHYLQTGIPL